MGAETEKFTIDFEETELRLGLPGKATMMSGESTNGPSSFSSDQSVGTMKNSGNKRGFMETVDLKLNLSNSPKDPTSSSAEIRSSPSSSASAEKMKEKTAVAGSSEIIAKPPAKAQVVGWPPVRSFRKNIMAVQKNSSDEAEKTTATANNNNNNGTTTAATTSAAAFVKVSMDGAPYLRKVDLKLYKSYQDLSDALAKMFSSFTIGNCGSQGMKDFMNESKLIDLLNGSEYVPTYEDKDGDWMLVGDVPWDMFVDSCKRLRIMKGSEAIGLAPRAVEKCKSRS